MLGKSRKQFRAITHKNNPGGAQHKNPLSLKFACRAGLLTLEAVNGDEGRGFGRNDPGVEVGKLVRLQVAAEDLKASCVKVASESPQHF